MPGLPRSFTRLLTYSYELVARALPPTLAASLDAHQSRYLTPWGGPFNGQQRRAELFLALVEAIRPRAIVETGTYRGATTEFMHRATGVPVWTVEKSLRFFEYARRRFRRFPEIHLARGDSRQFLRSLVGRGGPNVSEATLFYLDAHWNADLPLREELTIILDNWAKPVVMIDDFQIPDDTGYGYDDYGAGKRICFEYLPAELIERGVCFVPSIPSKDETGARRGCAVIVTSPLVAIVGALELLRAAPTRISAAPGHPIQPDQVQTP